MKRADWTVISEERIFTALASFSGDERGVILFGGIERAISGVSSNFHRSFQDPIYNLNFESKPVILLFSPTRKI
jgi:hypothetical protein